MYALHALWKSDHPGTLQLWGETSEKPATAKKPKGRQSKIPKPLPHPFVIEEEKLKELVTEISGSLIGESIDFEKLTIRLPSANDHPVPSPQLIRDQDEPPSTPEELKTWYLPSAIFEPGLALDFLLSLPNQSTPAIALGQSIRFWAEVAKFAIELITRQNFFPVVLEEKNETKSYRAAWSVYLSETDFTRMETLAKAMPPVCRAMMSEESPETPAPLKLVLHFLNQTTDHFVRQQLLTSNIFSKSTARPSGLALDTPHAYQFLRETAPLLEQSGFGVLLPAWWQKPALRLGVKLNVQPKANGASSSSGEGLLGMDGIVAYNWQIALGDQTLSPAEFEKLASLKVPLVKVRGQWVELKPEEIEKAIAFLWNFSIRVISARPMIFAAASPFPSNATAIRSGHKR